MTLEARREGIKDRVNAETLLVSAVDFVSKAGSEPQVKQILDHLQELLVGLPEARLAHVLPVFYKQLDPSKIPSKTDLQSRLPRRTTVDLAVLSLDVLASTCTYLTKNKSHELVFVSILESWPSIWCWIQFLLAPYTLHSSYHFTGPHSGHFSRPILFLSSFLQHPSLQDKISSTSGLIKLLFDVWKAETTAFPCHLRQVANNPSLVLLPLAPIFEKLNRMNPEVQVANWEAKVLLPMGGDVAEMASISLEPLRQDFSPWSDNDHAFVVANILSLSSVSCCIPIRNAQVAQRSISLVTNILVSLVENSNLNLVGKDQRRDCLPSCCQYLYAIFHGLGAPRIIQALKAGLLPALLKTDAWISLGDASSEYILEVFPEILSKYTIYPSVLRTLSDSLDLPAVEEHMVKTSPLWAAWTGLKGLAKERLQFYHSGLRPCDNLPKVCDNEECNVPIYATEKRLQMCSGCQEVYYCNTACQRRAWSIHKPFCLRAQTAAAEGMTLPKSDFRFACNLAVHDCKTSRTRDEIIALRQRDDRSIIAVHVDYREFPTKIRVGFTDTCNIDHDVLPPTSSDLYAWRHHVNIVSSTSTPSAVFWVSLPEGRNHQTVIWTNFWDDTFLFFLLDCRICWQISWAPSAGRSGGTGRRV